MCGIAGIVSAEPLSRDAHLVVRRMCASLRHRGPDEVGIVRHRRAILGMQRLAVIDLTPGQIPVSNEDGSVSVCLNGEIYNHQQIRRRLESHGHQFRTHTDTEVIARLYEQWGADFVHHLEGMFAISLWDERRQQLLLVRDRFGVKPLFYHRDAQRLRFGSEIKAILQDGGVPREPNLEALDRMLTFGCTAAPETFFEGIWELPPGSILEFRDGVCRVDQYWEGTEAEPSDIKTSAAIDEGIERIRQAVKKRLLSDVPLGAFLSGGIDSSLIVAFMSQLTNEPVKTFSIGFDDASFCELPYARDVARHFGTEHHEFIVKPNVAQLLPKLISHHDGPFYDSSAIPTYYLCRLARNHVTVALAGDGGDEMFAGYRVFAADRLADRMSRMPWALRDVVLPWVADRIPETSGATNMGRAIREFVRAIESDGLSRYARWASKTKFGTRHRLYRHPRLRHCLKTPDAERLKGWYDQPKAATHLSRLLHVATRGELVGDMLVKVDRMSMASALEVRAPFLDHTLWEWSQTLPDRLKLRGLCGKYLLRRIASRMLPPTIAGRSKRGFVVPLDRWLRTSQREWMQSVLLDDRTQGRELFDRNTVQQMIHEHLDHGHSYGRELWTLLTIEHWFRMYIDESPERNKSREVTAQLVTQHSDPLATG